MKYICLIILILLFSNIGYSQNFKGRITDKSGVPLYGSSVYIKSINQGLVCNEDGYYQTTLSSGKYLVEYKCLGYKSTVREIEIVNDKDLILNITLAENPFDLKEIVVSNTEDPAYAIIRKAIEKAPYHANIVKEYTADVYIKGNAELLKVASMVDKLAKKAEGVKLSDFKDQVFVQESFNEIHFTTPDKYKQTVTAFSSSIPDNLDSKDVMGIVNTSLYMPKIHSFISPLNPKAFSYYRFKYEGFSEENNETINKIKVEPKLKDPELLEGYIYIGENTWHIHSAELTSNTYGVKEKYTITFQKIDTDIYLPITYITNSELNMLGTQVHFNYYASLKYTDVKINEDVAKTFLRKEKSNKKRVFEIKADTLYVKTADSLSTQRDSLYWANIRAIPLDKREIVSYIKKDSIQHHLDSVRKEHHNPKFSISQLFTGGRIGGDSSKFKVKYSGLLFAAPEYNFVDGLWLGQKFQISGKLGKHNKLEISPYLYYATARKRLLGGGDITLLYDPIKFGTLHISVASKTEDFNPQGIDRLINSFTSLIQGKNHTSLYQRDFISINNSIDITNGLMLIAGFEVAKRFGLTNNTDYTWGRRKNIQPNMFSNDRFDKTAYHIGLDYTPYAYYSIKESVKKYEKFSSPTFFIRYAEGFSSWQTNNSQFRKLKGGLYQRLQLSYFDNLSYLAEGGTFIGSKSNIHFADYQHFNTSDLMINLKSPFSTFLLLNNYEASTNKYWIRTELNYTNKYIALKRLPFLQGKMFTETLHLKNLYTPDMKLYTEAGYSVNFTSLINAGAFVSFSKAKYRDWGIRFSFDMNVMKRILD